MRIAYFLWLLPFFFFIAGYLATAYITNPPACETPHCVGLPLHEALRILSSQGLSAKILEEKEDDTLQPGTVIEQRPGFKQKIKPNQTVYLIIATPSAKPLAPSLIGLESEIVAQQLKEMGVNHKSYSVPGTAQRDTCITQIPAAGTPLQDKKIITYTVHAPQNLVIFPDLIGKPAHECRVFLEQHGIQTQIFQNQEPIKGHMCVHCTIIDQKPLAGSLVILDKSLQVHINIDHK